MNYSNISSKAVKKYWQSTPFLGVAFAQEKPYFIQERDHIVKVPVSSSTLILKHEENKINGLNQCLTLMSTLNFPRTFKTSQSIVRRPPKSL